MNIKNKINNMDDARREKLGEVIRFGIVGGLATVLQYVIYLAMMPVLNHFIPQMGDHSLATTANTIAYIVSFIFNFIASTCGKLYDANRLPQPLCWSGARQTVGDDSYPLYLYPR